MFEDGFPYTDPPSEPPDYGPDINEDDLPENTDRSDELRELDWFTE